MAKFDTSFISSAKLWWLPNKGVAGPMLSLSLLFDGRPGVSSFSSKNFSQIDLNYLRGRKYHLPLSPLLESHKT